MAGHDRRIIIIALAAMAATAALTLAAAAWTGSAAVFAVAVQSLVGASSVMLIAYGPARASGAGIPADSAAQGHSLSFWSVVVALLLYALGAGATLAGGAARLTDPMPLAETGLIAGTLFAGFAVMTATALFVRAKVAQRSAEIAVPPATANPALATILIETVAAAAGISVAAVILAIGIVASAVDADAWAAIAVGLVLGVVAAIMSIETRRLLAGSNAARIMARPFFIEEDAHRDAQPAAVVAPPSATPASGAPPPSQPMSRKERKRQKHHDRRG